MTGMIGRSLRGLKAIGIGRLIHGLKRSHGHMIKMRHGLQDHNAQSAVATGVRVGASLEAEAILRGQETQSAVATGVRVEARVEAKTIPVRTQRTV